jgi:hypothetical protein
MEQDELTAVIAAIIHAGADHHEHAGGYTVEGAVKRARAILREVSKTHAQQGHKGEE